MSLKMYQVDAFSNQLFGGNPAAVLVLHKWLSDEVMQSIASENNLSETAFLVPSSNGWDLRWFTPTVEVDFCGHATLAAAHILLTEYKEDGILKFSTRVGDLTVTARDGSYLLNLPSVCPEVLDELPVAIASLFSGCAKSFFKNFENYFVELEGEEQILSHKPNLTAMAELGHLGVVITAASEKYDFVSRYFAPGAGISEDPVTGSIHATLVPFWAKKLNKNDLTAFQASPRGGILTCQLQNDRVLIEGSAITYMKGEIYLPS